MTAPLMNVIDCRTQDATNELARLRALLTADGDVVSERSRARTVELFGEPLSPRLVVTRILGDVRREGLPAVLEYTRKLDQKAITAETFRVSAAELKAAHDQADPAFLKTIRRIRDNVMEFQRAILHEDVTVTRSDGNATTRLQQRYRPLKRVGVCVPGGAAAYPSTLLMTVVPAQAAGVEEIAVVAPPTPFGSENPVVLATCCELGVKEVYRVGGAQAVAALAYGVEGLHGVDKIVGPGNLFVALAKQQVYGTVDIDSIAGPSEVIVVADETAKASHLASDLLSQAEHSPGSSVLITWHAPLVDAVQAELERQLATLERADLARASLVQYGAIIIVPDAAEACRLCNLFAPEHLHLSVAEPAPLLDAIQNAGAIFVGHETPVAVGDYFAGPSHVLPTGGTARFANGLCCNDFLKRSSIIEMNAAALKDAANDIIRLANVEGLTAHASSVSVRLQ